MKEYKQIEATLKIKSIKFTFAEHAFEIQDAKCKPLNKVASLSYHYHIIKW